MTLPTETSSSVTPVPNKDSDPSERIQNVTENAIELVVARPLATLFAAGAVGIVVGGLLWKFSARSRNSSLGSLERAVELARSGAVTTFQSLRRTLKEEGYRIDQFQGRALKQLFRRAISEAKRLNVSNTISAAWRRSHL
jgi:hypothetical protein